MLPSLTEADRRFAERAARRRTVFLSLSVIGTAVALLLAALYGLRWAVGAGESTGLRFALVVLILLNARQNLRQYRYAGLLEKLLRRPGSGAETR